MPKKKAKKAKSKKLNKKAKEDFIKAFKKHFIGELAGIPVYSSENFRREQHAMKKYSDSELFEAVKEEKQKIFTILNYILNKNSRPLSEGGVNYVKVFEEVQDFENYLLEDL